MMGLPPREEAMDGMNPGRDKKSKGSLIERYYENLGKKSSGLGLEPEVHRQIIRQFRSDEGG